MKKRWIWLIPVVLLVLGCSKENKIEETGSVETEYMTEEPGSSEPMETEESTEGTTEKDTTVSTEAVPPETEPVQTEPAESEPSEAPVETTTAAQPPAAPVVHMSLGEIFAYNQRVRSTPAAHMQDLSGYPEALPGAHVRGLVESYAIPAQSNVNGTPVTEGYKASMLERRNLAGIPETVTVRYAVTVGETALRSFPTTDRIGDGFDYYQESMFFTGECVAVLHTTADGGWSFVQGENYCGWVMTEKLAFTDRGIWISWWNQTVAGGSPAVALQKTVLSGVTCRMGTVLPLEGGQVILPVRDGNGQLAKVAAGGASGAFSGGYLPYTTENVMTQVNRMAGTPYGWGDEGGNPDCSSTVMSIYRCFGFRLARNTSWQMQMPGAERSLEGKYREEIIAMLQTKEPGSLLYMNGHVMMYIGMQNGEPMIFHNVTHYSVDGIQQVNPMQAVVTPLNICLRDGTSYYNMIHTVLDLSGQ